MSKRRIFLATLIAVFAVFTIVGYAVANYKYEYEPPELSCDGEKDTEWMRAILNNTSGGTIHVRRYWREEGGGDQWLDDDWYPLYNNQSRWLSLIKEWPTDIEACGFDVEEGYNPNVYLSNTANYCGY